MNWEVRYTCEARQDLGDILEYISYDLLSPETARRLVREIAEEIISLEHMPLRYSLYDEEPWRSQGVRFFPVKNYLIFYFPVEKDRTVYVLRVIYGGRDIRNQLGEIADI